MVALTVTTILERSGLGGEAIAAFMAHCPTMTLTLAKFERGLRSPQNLKAEKMLFGIDQVDDWDCFDSEILQLIQQWYLSVVSRDTAVPLDWDVLFTADIFLVYTLTAGPALASTSTTTADAAAAANTAAAAAATTAAASHMIPPLGYSHSYHDAVLLADQKDLKRRTGTAASILLTEHPLWNSRTISGAVKLDTKTFLNTSIDPLIASTPIAIHNWYRVLCHQATATNIDLCPLPSFDTPHALWPKNLPAPIVFEMSSALLLKIQSASVLDHSDTSDSVLQFLSKLHVSTSNSKLSAYYFLHALLAHAAEVLRGRLTTLPQYATTMDITKFASEIMTFRQDEVSNNRFYTDREMSLLFLQDLDLNGIEVQVPLKKIEELPLTAILPDSLTYTALVLKLIPKSSFSPPTAPHFGGVAHRLQQQRPLSSDRSLSRNSNPRGREKDSAPPRDNPFRQSEDVQCKACNIWGHSAKTCSGLAKTASLLQYITANPAHATTAVKTWQDLHSINHRKAVVHSLHLIGHDTTDLPLDDLSEAYCADFQ
jgi:hypothetical protein